MLRLLWTVVRAIKEGLGWVDVIRAVLVALGFGPLMVGLKLGIPLDAAIAWGVFAIVCGLLFVKEFREPIEYIVDRARGMDLVVLVDTTPQFEKLTSVNPPARLMRIGIRNPGSSLLERVVVQVDEIADLESVWPDGRVIELPFTLRQSRDFERWERARFAGFGPLVSRNRTTVVPHRDLETSFLLDGHATEYLDVAHAHDSGDAITIYSTDSTYTGVQLRASPRYIFILFIHGHGVRSHRVTLVCAKDGGRWRLRLGP